ncbi:MAG: hypothetical protein ACI9Y1_003237, partial [Lentisphaeria bacterium]
MDNTILRHGVVEFIHHFTCIARVLEKKMVLFLHLPPQAKHSIRLVGWTLPDRDLHPARRIKIQLDALTPGSPAPKPESFLWQSVA